jgi:predicted homoserine dehydrogenase-like protein
MNEQEIKEKALETALKVLDAKLKNDQKVYNLDAIVNDMITTAKKF